MKKLLYIIMPVLAICFSYYMFAFFFWSLDASIWGHVGRYLFLVISFTLASAGILMSYNINQKD